MTWRVGQKIVCINDSAFNRTYNEILPKKGEIYTIRDIQMASNKRDICFRLEEIRNKEELYIEGRYECNFYCWRFRAVVEDRTQFGLLTSILDKIKEYA